MHIYSRLEMVKAKIAGCQRFLEDDHPEFLKAETRQDLVYWQKELETLTK